MGGVEEIVNLFVNNSVAVAVIVYFCVRDWKFQNTLVVSLQTLIETISTVKEMVEKVNLKKEEN